MENIESVREVVIEKEIVNFQFKDNGSIVKEFALGVGYDYLINTFFKEDFPNESEIEKALNFIEYELSSNKMLVNNGEKLFCSNDILGEIIQVFGKKEISRAEIENMFDKYVDCATGEPAHVLQIDFSLPKFSVILIARAVMYYLNFEKIELS